MFTCTFHQVEISENPGRFIKKGEKKGNSNKSNQSTGRGEKNKPKKEGDIRDSHHTPLSELIFAKGWIVESHCSKLLRYLGNGVWAKSSAK